MSSLRQSSSLRMFMACYRDDFGLARADGLGQFDIESISKAGRPESGLGSPEGAASSAQKSRSAQVRVSYEYPLNASAQIKSCPSTARQKDKRAFLWNCGLRTSQRPVLGHNQVAGSLA